MFAVLYRHWIWIGPPLIVAAVVALLVAAFVLGIVAASSVFVTSLVFLVGRLLEARKGS